MLISCPSWSRTIAIVCDDDRGSKMHDDSDSKVSSSSGGWCYCYNTASGSDSGRIEWNRNRKKNIGSISTMNLPILIGSSNPACPLLLSEMTGPS